MREFLFEKPCYHLREFIDQFIWNANREDLVSLLHDPKAWLTLLSPTLLASHFLKLSLAILSLPHKHLSVI